MGPPAFFPGWTWYPTGLVLRLELENLTSQQLAAESALAVGLLTVFVLRLELDELLALRLAAESLLAVVLLSVLVLWLELEDHRALQFHAESPLAVVLLTVLLSWLEIEDLPALCLAAESLLPVVWKNASLLRHYKDRCSISEGFVMPVAWLQHTNILCSGYCSSLPFSGLS